ADPARLLRGRRPVRREPHPPYDPRRPAAPAAEPAVRAHHPHDLRLPDLRGRARPGRTQPAGHRGRGIQLVREQPERASRGVVRAAPARSHDRVHGRVPARPRAARSRGEASMNARTVDRTLIYGSAILLALWVIVPFYLIFLSAFSRPNGVFVYPKPLIPTSFSTETMEFFLQSTGVFASVLNSIGFAAITIVLSLALGAPAGYALARFTFRVRQGFQL